MKQLAKYKQELKKEIDYLEIKKLKHLASLIIACRNAGGTVFIAGNGGSAATASHMVTDLQKTTLEPNPKVNKDRAIRAISLTDNSALLTAWANDSSYDDIFAEPFRVMSDPQDLLIVITGSGNSKNIIKLLKVAKQKQIKSFALLGFAGGKAIHLADHHILINSSSYGIVEDMHMIIDHMLTEFLKTDAH